jgi:hypothetical protein
MRAHVVWSLGTNVLEQRGASFQREKRFTLQIEAAGSCELIPEYQIIQYHISEDCNLKIVFCLPTV